MQSILRARLQVGFQRTLGRIAFPILGPVMVCWLRLRGGYRIERLGDVRRRVAQLLGNQKGPVLICANHLTLIDSLLIHWAIFPMRRYLGDFRRFAWNMPERVNLEKLGLRLRVVAYLGKCIPISRGADPEETRASLAMFGNLLRSGDSVLVFPEGTRSRSGVVDTAQFAYGPGRLVQASCDVRVLCVYLRGASQVTWGDLPERGEHFYVDVELMTPCSAFEGLRGARDIATQIVHRLGRMERKYFASSDVVGQRHRGAKLA